MSAPRLPLSFIALVVVTGAACTNFDREDRIEDMRVLGIKTEPAEILYSPLHLLPLEQRLPILPLTDVDIDIQVFAFDPRGGRTETSIQLCPEGAGDSTCRLYDREQDLLQEPEAARDELRALLEPQKFDGVIEPTEQPIGRVSPNEFTWRFSPTVIDFFIPDASDGTPVPSIFPLLPRIVVEPKNLDVEPFSDGAPAVIKERAFKRIPVTLNLADPSLPAEVVADLARGLGISICPERIPDEIYDQQGRAECLDTRGPNNNPVLAGFYFEPDEELTNGLVTTETIAPDVPPLEGGVVEAAPGQQLLITPVFAEGVVERYQVISFDIEASKVIILNRVEDLALSWYSTRGEMSNALTALQFGETLGIIWSLPGNAESGERDSLVVVIVDQRGGTTFGEITVTYP